MKELTKVYPGGKKTLENIWLSFLPGAKIGVLGANGAGKSTVLDALCFALFGKPFRNINKPQLVNAINEKELMVEIDFSIGKKDNILYNSHPIGQTLDIGTNRNL